MVSVIVRALSSVLTGLKDGLACHLHHLNYTVAPLAHTLVTHPQKTQRMRQRSLGVSVPVGTRDNRCLLRARQLQQHHSDQS